MNKVTIFLLALLVIGAALVGLQPSVKVQEPESVIRLPDGFRIDVFAEGLGGSILSTPGPSPGPRMMLLKDDVLFVSITGQGRVVALPDRDGDWKTDESIDFISGLNRPHGLDYHNGWFYIAEENRVVRVMDLDSDLRADVGTLEVLIENIPTGGHFTRTVKIINGSLFLSVGSSCNVCYEDGLGRAAITRCDLDGQNCDVFATGLRNAVGFVEHPETGQIFATENGRDWLGDDLPPDEVNLIEEGKNYGWPICYGKRIHDSDFDKNVYVRDPCEDTEPSLVDLQAHSAPLGLAFYFGEQFPAEYTGKLFVAYHGSWNRNQPTGYKVVAIDIDSGEVTDFATGWLQGSNVLGRPVDLVVASDGSLLVSDDNAGLVYRIYYSNN